MTPKQSTARLALYCAAAFIMPIAANWNAMEHATIFQWAGMLIQSSLTAIIAARAYIDQSPNQVDK